MSLALSPAALAAPPTKDQLELQKLQQEVRQLRAQNDRAGSTRQTILDWAPFVTVLVAVAGVVLPLQKAAREQRNQRQQELAQRQVEERRRFDDLFAQAVGNLGSDNESVRVSGAVTLDNFLREGYEPFHEQVYSVLCANLAVAHTRLVNRFIVRGFERALRLHLAGADPRPPDLVRCQLTRADLHDLKLDGTDLAFANLKDANLSKSSLVRARGIEVKLERARLSGAILTEVRFNGAACAGAHFHNARLVSAEFRTTKTRVTDLRNAEFYGAQLQGAHFDGADLRGAAFDNANLADAFFPDATFNDAALRSIAKSENWEKATFDDDVRKVLARLAATRRPAAPVVTP